jgi:hypothetical protein
VREVALIVLNRSTSLRNGGSRSASTTSRWEEAVAAAVATVPQSCIHRCIKLVCPFLLQLRVVLREAKRERCDAMVRVVLPKRIKRRVYKMATPSAPRSSLLWLHCHLSAWIFLLLYGLAPAVPQWACTVARCVLDVDARATVRAHDVTRLVVPAPDGWTSGHVHM